MAGAEGRASEWSSRDVIVWRSCDVNDSVCDAIDSCLVNVCDATADSDKILSLMTWLWSNWRESFDDVVELYDCVIAEDLNKIANQVYYVCTNKYMTK